MNINQLADDRHQQFELAKREMCTCGHGRFLHQDRFLAVGHGQCNLRNGFQDNIGNAIWPNTKTVYHTNPISGHEYSTQEPMKGFYIAGPCASVNQTFKSEAKAKEHIDFIIKFLLMPNFADTKKSSDVPPCHCAQFTWTPNKEQTT